MIWIIVLSKKSAGNARPAKTKLIKGKYVCGMLYGFGVSLYQVSACKWGYQHMAFVVGPRVMTRPTNHAQRVADNANNNLIYAPTNQLNIQNRHSR